MRVGLLLVGHIDAKSTHVAGDYPDLFGALLEGLGIELVRYDIDQGRFPASSAECDGWLCSPSRSSTNDALPWRADAEALLRELLDRERPFVGICFGHQLLGRVLGAPVVRAPTGWEVGVQDYEVLAPAPWMGSPPARLSLIASHQDQLAELPPGARLLARSPGCPVAGLLVGERAWSLQAHPELVPALADHLLAGRVELIGAERVRAARATLGRPLDRRRVAGWIARCLGAPLGPGDGLR